MIQTAFADAVTATIPVGIMPTDVKVNPITNMIYVTNYADNTVSVINGTNNTVINTIPVGHTPYGIGVNKKTNMIYVANFDDNTVSVIPG